MSDDNAGQTTTAEPMPMSQPGGGYESVDAAIDAMFAPSRERDAGGRFAANAPAPGAAVVDMKGKLVEQGSQPAKAADAKIGHNGGPELEEYFFEFEPEEAGKEPTRVKSDEVFAAYHELPKLRGELEKLKTAPPVPDVYVEEMQQTAAAREKYVNNLAYALSLYEPRQPDRALINPLSERYDPDAFARQMSQYEAESQEYTKRRHHLDGQLELHQQNQQRLALIEKQRAEPKILADWPDLKDINKRREILDRASNLTGLSVDEIKAHHDPRAWRILKGFLENEEAKTKKAEAVAVVRAKPKLVRGTARATTTTTDSNRNTAMDRFKKSFSIDDAVDALLG